MDRKIFISLLSQISVLIGNSSCGILEAPSLKLPAVNIGTRQNKRLRAKNVIDVENVNEDKLTKAIQQSVELLTRKDFENYIQQFYTV